MLAPKTLVVTPKGFSVSRDKLDPAVIVHLHIDENHLGLAPGVGLAIRMSSVETRRFAEVLARKADEAEEGIPRA